MARPRASVDPLDRFFAAQRGRVKYRLAQHRTHLRGRLERECAGVDTVEVRGTAGGGPSVLRDEDAFTYRTLGVS